jgi:polyisoprenoid-binding protein YceI
MVPGRLPVLWLAPIWLVLVVPSMAEAQTPPTGVYSLNRAASAVGFTISASMLFKFKENGKFTDFTGNLSYDPARPADTQMDLTVYTASVDTHNTEHDQMLKSADFFDVQEFPTMHFVSALTTAKPDGTFSMTGDMTIRGVTKRLTIPVRMRRALTTGDPSSAVFESTFQIDRTEFGLNGVPKWGGLKVSISKKVEVHIAMATTINGAKLER